MSLADTYLPRTAMILKHSCHLTTMEEGLCLCFPCILMYLGGYVFPAYETQTYPQLQQKGFTPAQQRVIAEEWYWVAVERETAVKDYLRGYVTFRDGCYWRPPPRPPQRRPAPRPSTRSSEVTNSSPDAAGPST